MKIVLALDIDGTIAEKASHITDSVKTALQGYAKADCHLLFVTGRTFFLSIATLQVLQIPYWVAPYNSAQIVRMPDAQIIQSLYLDRAVILKLVAYCCTNKFPLLAYPGELTDEYSFVVEPTVDASTRQIIETRRQQLLERMQFVQALPDKRFLIARVVVKGLEAAFQTASEMEKIWNVSAIVMSDVTNSGWYIIQVSHPSVDKGNAIREVRKFYKCDCKVIAAGDDFNDLALLREADISIAMDQASEKVKAQAMIVAPPASAGGIEAALEEAYHVCIGNS